MKLERLQTLLDTYGGNPDRWPHDERDAALQLLSGSPAAQDHAAEQRRLDEALDAWEPAVPALEMAALEARLPPRNDLLDRILAWLLPSESAAWWQPISAAACTLALGIVFGSTVRFDFGDDTSVAGDSWEDELYLLALETPDDAGDTAL